MMKCPYCGAPLDLDDNFCPNCGNENEQAKQHIEDMNRFKNEFSETKEEVYATAKRYTAVTVRVVMIAILLIANVVFAVIGSNYYSFMSMIKKADCSRNFEEYSAIMDAYLEAGDYQAFHAFVTEKNMSFYDTEYEQYVQVDNLVNQYIWFYDNLLHAATEEDMEYREDLCGYALDYLQYFYEQQSPEYYMYYENIDREVNENAIKDMNRRVELLLAAYGNISEEDAAQFASYTPSQRGILLEEGLLNVEENN